MTLLLEYWKPVVGFESHYIISNTGRVYSFYTHKDLKPRESSGYLRVSLSKKERKALYLVHDLVCRTFNGPRPEGKIINHINGYKLTNRPSNLEYVTYAQNSQHAALLGINNRGEKHGLAKLNEAKVREIRSTCNHSSPRQQADLYGVHIATIHRVLDGTSWRHVPPAGTKPA